MKLLSFDLEIAQDVRNAGEDWKSMRPFGISCAAVAYRGAQNMITYGYWEGRNNVHKPENWLENSMTRQECSYVVDKLVEFIDDGYSLVTVNGAGFDFDVLAEESGRPSTCSLLAAHHYDLCFMVLAKRGFPLGLDAIANGAGIAGKLHEVILNSGEMITDMSGAKAPELWWRGERGAVKAYLKDDVRSTLEAAEVVAQRRRIDWTSRAGKYQSTAFSSGLLTVQQANMLPKPDTSWMTNKITRMDMIGWMNR